MYLASARRVTAWKDGGSMVGGPKRAIWHTTENDPHKTTAYTIAQYLNRVGYQVHIVWNPVTGEIVQMIGSDRAGRGLRNESGGVQTNREGAVCVQVEVVAHAKEPFTKYEMKGREAIISYLRSLGVPDVWPGGPPPASPGTKHVSNATWNSKGGHYGHSQTPENNHSDPGAIDIKKLLGAPSKPGEWPGVHFKLTDPMMHGSDVKWIQQQLNAKGAKPKLDADGWFGRLTDREVKDYQKTKKLQVDGVVGARTWASLDA